LTEATGAQLETLQSQVSELETRRDALERDVAGYDQQLATHQPQVEDLTANLAQRSSEHEAVEAEIAQAIPATTAAAPSDAPADMAASGTYRVLAEGQGNGISLALSEDGSFDMQDRLSRTVSGRYTMSADQLVLSDATGR